jgi:hypothetical protein
MYYFHLGSQVFIEMMAWARIPYLHFFILDLSRLSAEPLHGEAEDELSKRAWLKKNDRGLTGSWLMMLAFGHVLAWLWLRAAASFVACTHLPTATRKGQHRLCRISRARRCDIVGSTRRKLMLYATSLVYAEVTTRATCCDFC